MEKTRSKIEITMNLNKNLYIPPKNLPPNETPFTLCIKQNSPLFSSDIIPEDGAKRFFTCGWEYFCNNYYKRAHLTNPHIYEVILQDTVCKIFIDVDYKFNGETDSFDCEKHVDAIKKHAQEVFQELFSIDTQIEYIELDSSRPNKFSKHIIWQLFVQDIKQVEKVVQKIIEKDPENNSKLIDSTIYNKSRSFRLVYSSKMGRNKKRLMPNGSDELTYDPKLVFKSMVTTFIPKGTITNLIDDTYPESLYNIFENENELGTESKYSISSRSGVSQDSIPPKLNEFFDSIGAVVRSVSANDDTKVIYFILGELTCPWTQRVHKSNNTYFTLNCKTAKGYFKCADGDCPCVTFDTVDLWYIWNDQ